MIIRMLPDSKAVEALCICYEKQRVYHHQGIPHFVTSLTVAGSGREARVEAELNPVWNEEVVL
ncbi:hypothetical protein VV869_23700 [Photobacterium sp. MCCC 1A19761]|uniref:hypothetical protein n=1 Tax=Photobacterium sp. MCCC 1A19761 TaxID=3115000 RepID=UPI00307D7332